MSSWMNLLIGVVCAAGGLIPVVVALRGMADAIAGRVVSVDGPVRSEANTGSESTTYRFRIGSMSFQVPMGAYRALVSGMTYRIYYTPLSRTLVSIELLG